MGECCKGCIKAPKSCYNSCKCPRGYYTERPFNAYTYWYSYSGH